MKSLNHFYKFVPYLYFISITIIWFTIINKTNGISAYPILLFGIPFIWQLIKPSNKLNFALGITFVCVSSYLIIAYISDSLDIIHLSSSTKNLLFLGGIFIPTNFIMSLWIFRNSLKGHF
ncbi:hypothetical protein CSW08_17970 [Confluentibacter flavum]|uniref:Uncharacterized protein n=1 Tax=Confluentibacter flavum TaxID=1909700 RepID=A0A2N3HF06_9FLAO|nr:hypothetical protein CSW08_17970 [Confluentibacter flavum]